MARWQRRTLSVLVLTFYAACWSVPARACGPYLPEAIFTSTLHPDLPLVDLAAGKLGLLPPTYARSYLYVAYHQLNGGAFDAAARQALDELWKARLGRGTPPADPEAVEVWHAARAKVLRTTPAPAIERTRAIEGAVYQYYANCLDDAFTTAARTLDERIAHTGVEAPEVRAWVGAQDQVFANCGGLAPVIPEELPETAGAPARADRRYQIAAANFYAGRFDDAARLFGAIAADDSSPWAPHASYLVARALIRKASLADGDPSLAARASQRLEDVVRDPKAAALAPSARGLLDLVRVRSDPEAQLRTLAARLLQPMQGADVGRPLSDYTVLVDQWLEKASEGVATGAAAVAARDALTDWIVTFQAADAAARDHAVDRWEKTHAPVWLVAAIAKVEPTHPIAAALLAAINDVEPSFPGVVTVAAHAARLEIGRRDLGAARRRLDALLGRSDLPRGTVNRLRGLRMATAESAADFIGFAARTPVGVTYDYDGNELPDDVSGDPLLQSFAAGRPAFDSDATFVLNHDVPLTTLAAFAAAANLDADLRRRVALAGWVRALLLDDEGLAEAFAKQGAALAPELHDALIAYAGTPAGERRRFAGIVLLLHAPGLGPYVRPGVGRTAPVHELDDLRDNWWCDVAHAGVTRPEWAPNASAAFVAAAERARAAEEWSRLAALPSAPTHLAAGAVAYGRAHPKDEGVAEALHLAVRATRYGCTDAASSAQSKAAFQLLHRQYPKTEWAAKTKYSY